MHAQNGGDALASAPGDTHPHGALASSFAIASKSVSLRSLYQSHFRGLHGSFWANMKSGWLLEVGHSPPPEQGFSVFPFLYFLEWQWGETHCFLSIIVLSMHISPKFHPKVHHFVRYSKVRLLENGLHSRHLTVIEHDPRGRPQQSLH